MDEKIYRKLTANEKILKSDFIVPPFRFDSNIRLSSMRGISIQGHDEIIVGKTPLEVNLFIVRKRATDFTKIP